MDSDQRCTQLPVLHVPHEEGGGGSRAASQPQDAETAEQPKHASTTDADLDGRDSGSMTAHVETKLAEKVKRTRGRKPKASSAKSKGRPKGKLKSASTPERQKEKRDDEDVCFICFDGGELVLCDRRGCPKAYHPACIKRDRSFFRCKAKWNCGWHICSSCQKKAHYVCYTCTYSLCKSCVKGADYIGLRETKGLCGTCRKTIMLIENIMPANEEKVQVDFDDQLSWEYLFKVYWSDLKEKLSLTTDEIIQAKNPKRQKKRKRKQSIEQVQNGQDKPRKARRGNEQRPSFCQSMAWASSELLEFISFMKDGDKSVISRYDVQALLLEYISRYNLHDPRQKWQIFCDGRLAKLFGKASLDQFEMLKLLDSHFHLKENTQVDGFDKWMLGNAVTGHLGIDLNNDKDPVATDDQKNENSEYCDERVMISQDFGATKNAHSGNLKFVRRNFIESLIDDSKFSEKIIGSVVRIRTSNNDQNQEMYRMAQVIGTSKAEHTYQIGGKTTNIKLEIQNLDRKAFVSIDEISNEDCTKDEWRYLDQIIRGGAVQCLTKDEILQNTAMVKSEKVVEEREATGGVSSWNSAKNHQHTDSISSLTREAASGYVPEISPSPLSTATEVSVNDDETCKMWLYQDPSGKIQGPFTMSQMRKWRTVGQLPLNLRIWRLDEKKEDSILLEDALVMNGRRHFLREQGMALLSSSSQHGKQGGGAAARGAEDSRGEMSSISVDINRTMDVDGSRIAQTNVVLKNFTCKGKGGNNLHESSEMGSCFSGSSPVDVESEKKNMEKSESLNSLKEATPPDERFSQFNADLNSSSVKKLLQCDGGDVISSSQSTGQNWKALSPVISSSNDGSSKVKSAAAAIPSLTEKLQQKSMIDFLDPPPTASTTRFKAAAEGEELGQSHRGVKLEQWDSTTSTATTTTVVSSCRTPKPVVEPCSSISIDGATLTLGPDPVLPTASSWQVMLLEPVEITSLPDEAVSDLLAELEASEPPLPLNTSSSKNEGFHLEADFFPVLSPSSLRNELPLGYASSGGMASQRVVTWHEGTTTNPTQFQMSVDPMRWGPMMQNMGGWGGGVMSHHHGYRNMFGEPGGGSGVEGNAHHSLVGLVPMNYVGGSSHSFSHHDTGSRYAPPPPPSPPTLSPRDQFFEDLNLDLGRGGSSSRSFWENLNNNNNNRQ